MTAITASVRNSLVVALAGAASIVAFSTTAHADDTVPQVRVSYSDLDLDSEADARQLYRRLRAAADTACRQFDGKDLHSHALERECKRNALDRAVRDVNHPMVLALHGARGDIQVAQKNGAQTPRG